MHLIHALSETAPGRALIAYFFDLPRWTLFNLLFAVALLPAYLLLNTGNGLTLGVEAATLPTVPVIAGMINMAASQTIENAPRLRDALAHPATLLTVFAVWAVAVVALALLGASTPSVAALLIAIVLLALLMIGVFAIYLPSQLKVNGGLIWRNALVLGVRYPIIGLGLLMLGGLGVWAVYASKGTLIVVVPSLWVVLAAFTVDDCIKTIRAAVTE
jgi:hypothetical protein